LGWSICPDKGGQFRPEMGGQFAPDSLVNLLRIEVVKFIGFSIINLLSQNVEQKESIIGHILKVSHVTVGGNPKLNGIDRGRIIFLLLGKKSFYLIQKLEKSILPMLRQSMGW
jgi:hypothetical protein